jgi:hypothetical protein
VRPATRYNARSVVPAIPARQVTIMIRGFILLSIALLAAVPVAAQPSASAAWRTDVPCSTGRNPPLALSDTAADARVAGCVRSQCVALRDGRRVCTCLGDTTTVLRVEEGGRVVQEWPADYSSGYGGSLRVLTGDLDGDGRAETIVSDLVDMSNGLGIRYYALHIIDGRDPARPPVVAALDDYDPEGSFVRPAGGGPCRLIATRWNELREPRRGSGMYFIGQWMRYRDGRLEHDPARPVVARRLLYSFADTRFTTRGAPFAHLRHRDAQARPDVDPWSLLPLMGRQAGTVRGVHGSNRDSVEVALASGQTVRYRLGQDFGGEDTFGTTWTWLVDGATGRPYPREYTPSNRTWLDGAPVRIISYSDGDGRTVHRLIIQPRTQ